MPGHRIQSFAAQSSHENPLEPDDYANPGSKPDDYAGDDRAAQDCRITIWGGEFLRNVFYCVRA